MVILIERVGDLMLADESVIGHGVNCSGLMGAGVAKNFRNRYPEMYFEYVLECQKGWLQPGGVHIWRDRNTGTVVVNLATQDVPGPNASLKWIRSSLSMAFLKLRDGGLPLRLAIPRIGCGIGGLSWHDEVKPTIEEMRHDYTVPSGFLIVYTLQG